MSTIDIGIALPLKQTTPPPVIQRKPASPAPAQTSGTVSGPGDFYVGSTKLDSAAVATA